MKEKNLQTLILSEFYSSILYLDRIYFFLLKIPQKEKQVLFLLQDFYQQITTFLNHQIILFPFKNLENKNCENLYLEIKKVLELTTQFFSLSDEEDFQKKIAIPFINLIFRKAHELHLFCQENNLKQIELPRTSCLNSKELESLPLFYFDLNNLENSPHCPILSLEEKRKNKYKEFLAKGLDAISYKQHYKAIEFLITALNYKETAEILSLLGWLHTLINKTDLAKDFCKRSIKLDPEFGPPYNDLGLIFMEEGDLKESLNLFNLAKRAPKYQNREFPYINSGRIYMFLKKYSLALRELRMALTLVPGHQNLHDTIQKLLQSIPSEKLCLSEEIN